MAVGSMSSSKRSLLRILCAIILLLFLVFRQYRQLWHLLVASYDEYYEPVNEPVYEHYPTTPAIADERKQQDVVHHIVGDSFFPRLIGLDEGAPRPPYMADKNRAERADDVEVKVSNASVIIIIIIIIIICKGPNSPKCPPGDY
jgi:hypothetical protein